MMISWLRALFDWFFNWKRRLIVKKRWSKWIDGSRIGFKLATAGKYMTEYNDEEMTTFLRYQSQDRRFLKMYNGYGPFEEVPSNVDLDHPYSMFGEKTFIDEQGVLRRSKYRGMVKSLDSQLSCRSV